MIPDSIKIKYNRVLIRFKEYRHDKKYKKSELKADRIYRRDEHIREGGDGDYDYLMERQYEDNYD